MARGRKKALTDEELVVKLTEDIAQAEANLKELKAQKKTVEDRIKAVQLAELNDIIKESGKTFDEVREMLKQ